MGCKHMAAQPPRIGITHVIDPALDAGIQFREADAARLIQIDIVLEKTGTTYSASVSDNRQKCSIYYALWR